MSVSSNSSTQSTVSQLRAQWLNPGDILSILLIIGGDIVQKALAQTTAGRIPPVCFSFGWVAYSFTTLVGVVGDGRLLPPPDYPVKVFNLESSYVRENKNWVIGRILRDNEVFMNTRASLNGAGIRISIYTAVSPRRKRWMTNRVTEVLWLLITFAQIGVAAVPLALENEWGVFLITCSGIAAAIIAGLLPQWSIEKLPLKRNSSKYIALTTGNGSREIMIIYGAGVGLDLEELAAGESPRSDRVWEASTLFSELMMGKDGTTMRHKNGNYVRKAFMYKGLPVGLWLTRVVCFFQAIFWVALLITVAGLRSHTWYLVLVGGLGMLQNAIVASVARSPDRRGLPLILEDTIVARGAMDGLMDLQTTINGAGQVLLDEFFPGSLREEEIAWWSGYRDSYDDQRMEHKGRGRPRSRLQRKAIGIPDIDTSGKLGLSRRMSSWESAGFMAEAESGPVSPLLPSQDLEPVEGLPIKKPVNYASPAHETPNSQLPARNDYRRAEHSEDSVRSPDWA